MKKLPVSVQSFSHDSWQKLLAFYEATVEAEVYQDEKPTLLETLAVFTEDDDDATSV